MRKVTNISGLLRLAWSTIELAICIGVIVVGLSLLGGFVAHQYIDWKQSNITKNK